MRGYYTIEVRDREGKLLRRLRRKSRSYVRQWNELICANMGPSTNRTSTDTGGTSRTIVDAIILNAEAPAANSGYGIVVGTGATAVAISDYALAAQIVHGIGSGQMYHYAVAVGAPSVAGPTSSFTVTRVIGNQSGATITVGEIGVYVYGQDSGGYSRVFLGIRDVLASSFDVPNGGSITVVYTIMVTV